jgi:single-stranded DNA-specific DHH superfamily exonuclease
MSLNDFENKANQVIGQLRRVRPREITVVYHDDPDGLCSAAVTKTALEREGLKVKTFCLEKVYTEVI